jgi:hypothetical protein
MVFDVSGFFRYQDPLDARNLLRTVVLLVALAGGVKSGTGCEDDTEIPRVA